MLPFDNFVDGYGGGRHIRGVSEQTQTIARAGSGAGRTVLTDGPLTTAVHGLDLALKTEPEPASVDR